MVQYEYQIIKIVTFIILLIAVMIGSRIKSRYK